MVEASGDKKEQTEQEGTQMSARSEPPFSARRTTGTTATVISSYDQETNNSIDLCSVVENQNPSSLNKAEEYRMNDSDQIGDRQAA